MSRFFINSILITFVLVFAGCTSSRRKANSSITVDQPVIDELFSLYERGSYFKLRDRLQAIQNTGKPTTLFLLAAVYHAFNLPAKSNQVIQQVLNSNSSPPDTLMGDLRSLKLANYLRLYQYKNALKSAKAIIEAPNVQTDSAEVANANNMSKLFRVLADTPPQKITNRKTTTLPITRDKAKLQRIPVRVGKIQQHFVLDTGAGFSTIMQSAAQKAGLKIRDVGLKVKSATGKYVIADIAVAKQVFLGHIVYKNVLFLVLPDKALSFPQFNYRIPGIIGFPVIEAAGEIQFLRSGILKIPVNPPNRTVQNLALDGLSPRVRIGLQIPSNEAIAIQADTLACTLDTGAMKTPLLAPFFKRYRKQVMQLGRPDTVHIGGAGKITRSLAYILPKVQLKIGGAHIMLKNVQVRTQPSFEGLNSSLACNIGQDVLSKFDKIIMNFRSMSLILQ